MALAEAGSGTLVGVHLRGISAGQRSKWQPWREEANLLRAAENLTRHGILQEQDAPYSQAWAWVLREPCKYRATALQSPPWLRVLGQAGRPREADGAAATETEGARLICSPDAQQTQQSGYKGSRSHGSHKEMERARSLSLCRRTDTLQKIWWSELAVPAALEEAPGVEAQLFWTHFQVHSPEEALRLQKAAKADAAELSQDQTHLVFCTNSKLSFWSTAKNILSKSEAMTLKRPSRLLLGTLGVVSLLVRLGATCFL